MKIIIKYNIKLAKWTIFLNNKALFSLFILKNNKINNYSIFFYNYLLLLKILRQFGLKKVIKNYNKYL